MLTWRYVDYDGQPLGSSERFENREEAEAWIGLAWIDLYSNGIEEVELIDEERGETLYRMALAQEGAER